MSDTKQYTHNQFNMPGPAVLKVYDDVNDYFYRVGYLGNIRIRRESDSVYQSEIHVGRSVAIDGYSTAERMFLSFDVMEKLNPDMLRLIMKNCGTPATFQTCSLLTVTEEMKMYRGHAQVLNHNNGFYGDGALPAPANPAATAAGAGATIPTGTYVIVIEAVYTDAGGLNPVRSGYVNTGGVGVVLGQELTVTWDAPGGGYEPHHYNIYEYDTAIGETRVDADLIAIINGSSPTAVIFTSFTDLGDWPGDTTGGAFTVTSDSITPSPFTAGDDYTIDTTCARLAILDDGDIDDGELLLVTYTYIANPFYTQTIGPGSRNPRIIHWVIEWFKDDERAVPLGRGCEIHLYHVHSESGFEWLFDAPDFESGMAQEYRVLIDSATGTYGQIYAFHKVMETIELIDLEALSKYTNDDECAIVSS